MDAKKGILGTIGVGVLAVGGFLWDNGGKQVVGDTTKTAIQQAAPQVKAMIPEPFKSQILGGKVEETQANDFQAAYERCHDRVGKNPHINLNDPVAVFDASVKCLIVEENQGATLDKMAESDAELKQTLADFRLQISQQQAPLSASSTQGNQ